MLFYDGNAPFCSKNGETHDGFIDLHLDLPHFPLESYLKNVNRRALNSKYTVEPFPKTSG